MGVMVHHFYRAMFIFGIIVMTMPAFCQQTEKIVTDRPDQTESPYTVPKNWFQSETGFNVEKDRNGFRSFLHPTILNKYGISNRFELRLITEWASVETPLPGDGKEIHSGMQPIVIGGKVRFFEEKGWRPKTSLILHASIPHAASRIFRQSRMAPAVVLTMQNSLSKNIGLGYNVGAEWDGESNGPTWIITLTSGFDLGERWYLYAEIFNFLKDGEHPLNNVDGGVSYTISNNTQVDFSYGYGLNPHA